MRGARDAPPTRVFVACALTYAVGILASLMRLRLQLYDAVLDDALRRRASVALQRRFDEGVDGCVQGVRRSIRAATCRVAVMPP